MPETTDDKIAIVIILVVTIMILYNLHRQLKE
jgi:hypothetical protein